MACNCINELQNRVMEQLGAQKCLVVNRDLVSGRTYSTISIKTVKNGKATKNEQYFLHPYCPFCGKAYVEEMEE